MAYVDHPRDLRISSEDGFIDWLGEWVAGMSDASITEAHYLDAGDYSIARFRGRGTNDGQLGPANATGGRMDLDFCEILRVEGDQVAAGALYYDQLTLLVQLGVIEAPPAG